MDQSKGGQAVSSIKISGFINDPWRDIGQDAMERGAEICKRNDVENPDANMVMLIGICDIINELKAKEAKP
jgi:uncharacterized protein YfeS